MDEKKPQDICGETKSTGRIRWICDRTPHLEVKRSSRRNHRDGINFFDEPPSSSHRFVNLNRV